MQTKLNQANPDRYVVLLDSNKKSDIVKAQKELNTKLVSSEELNSETRAHNIMSADTGIIFKNLGIAIVDNIEEKVLKKATASASSILYWEKEREYYAVDQFSQLEEVKRTSALLQEQIAQLEEILRDNDDDEDLIKWASATWGIDAINLVKSKFSGKGIDIAVLDTGLYKAHPDFQNRSITGKSFIQGQNWDLDGNGHGTHCIGIAAGGASSDEDKRYGVASGANIVAGKVLADSGSGSTSGIIDAIDWAIEKKYRVISMSLGSPVNNGERPSPIIEHVGRKALENNCLLIAAAGNDSHRPNIPRPVSSPANAESIMAVAALDKNQNIAYFSNGGINAVDGGRIDLAAPGVEVFSSFSMNAQSGRLYRTLNGTSMATPFVAGVAALYMEAFPSLSAAEIWLKMEKNAKALDGQLLRDVGQGLCQSI